MWYSTKTFFERRFNLYITNSCGTVESFNDWGGWGCRKFVPFLGGDSTKIASTGDIFDEPPGEMS